MMKDEAFTFWYPLLESKQLAFREDGIQYEKEIFTEGEGHIMHQGRLMCGESMNVLKTRLKTKKHSIKKQRVADKKLCPTCQEKYKDSPSSVWNIWERGEGIKSDIVITVLDNG